MRRSARLQRAVADHVDRKEILSPFFTRIPRCCQAGAEPQVTVAHLRQLGDQLASQASTHKVSTLQDRSCTARVRVMHRGFPKWTCVIQMTLSAEVSNWIFAVSLNAGWRFETQCPHSCSQSSTVPSPYCTCGHGGTRNISTSLRLHTRSVSPAPMAGVRARQVM